jgi:hypothetical protein
VIVILAFPSTGWSPAVQRTFNVAIGGSSSLSNFAIAASAESGEQSAGRTGHHSQHLQSVIAFTQASVHHPCVSGIEGLH